MGLFRRTVSPLASWPEMKVLRRQGGVWLHGKYAWPGMDPFGRSLFAIGLIVGMYFVFTEGGGLYGALGLAAGFIIPLPFIGRSSLISLMGSNLNVRILPHVIYVKRRRYDRKMVKGFRIERHHKAIQEARSEIRRGKPGQRWYREAVEVVMDYGEKRITVAAMPDRDMEQAEALLYRLQGVHKDLEAFTGRAQGRGPAEDDPFGPPPPIR